MKSKYFIKDDILYDHDGKINTKPSDNLDLERGLFNGVGISLTKTDAKPQRIYIKWSTLNSHKLTIGTTRQGKSRKMISDIEQQIANDANVFIGEPKGSENQEIIGYVLQLAIKYKREKEIMYISAYYNQYSAKFNPLFRKKNSEISSLIGEMIEAKEPVYKNVGRSRALAILLGTDFIEKFDALENPYDLIIMERYEYAKLEAEKVNWMNKHIFGAKYSESEHGYKWDIKKTLIENAKDEREIKLINEAYMRTLERNKKSAAFKKGDVLPLRTYITFEDLSKFDTVDSLAILQEEVRIRFENLPENADEGLRWLGSQAMVELEKRMRDDPTFIGKLLNSYAMVLTDVTTEDVGLLLNSCRINPVLDALTSNDKGAIIIYQPFPMIYSAVSNVLGRIMFSMFSSMSGYIGASGVMLKRRLFVNIDEAGAILSPIVRELSNKGGGLGFSLCLYTQSIADIIDTLEETGARIILDNMNTKEFFKVNDNTTAQEVSTIMGTIRKVETTTTCYKEWLKISREKDLAKASNKTIKDKLIRIGAFLNFCVDMEHLDKNRLIYKIKIEDSDKRKEYKIEQLNSFFNSKWYTEDLEHNLKEEPHKIWIPLILLFTGARTNEIAQLYVEHIKEKEGIHLFKIKDEQEDQSTKNKSSNREVPIHKTLIDLGFLKYVEYQKKLKKDRLFSGLYLTKNKGYGQHFGKIFNEFKYTWLDEEAIEKLNNNEILLDLHSFRHSFTTASRKAKTSRRTKKRDTRRTK
jgi:hypothetical protein